MSHDNPIYDKATRVTLATPTTLTLTPLTMAILRAAGFIPREPGGFSVPLNRGHHAKIVHGMYCTAQVMGAGPETLEDLSTLMRAFKHNGRVVISTEEQA